MQTETIAALTRSYKIIFRCEAHLAELHRELDHTSSVMERALKALKEHEAMIAAGQRSANAFAGAPMTPSRYFSAWIVERQVRL